MNSVRLLELVRKAGVAIDGHDELVAIEVLVALVECETIQRGGARMNNTNQTYKTYIGDSVYAETENGMIKLTSNNGGFDSNTIYLELEVYEELKRYVSRQVERMHG